MSATLPLRDDFDGPELRALAKGSRDPVHVCALSYRKLSARPSHPPPDLDAQEAFTPTFPPNWQKLPPTWPAAQR